MSNDEQKMEWESDEAYAERIAIQAWRRRIKDWAVENGWQQPAIRGRLPGKLRMEYVNATGDDIAEILRRLRRST